MKNEELDINQCDYEGETPFYICCQKGYYEIVALLLSDKRLNFLSVTAKGRTPLSVAKSEGHKEIAELVESLIKNRSTDFLKYQFESKKLNVYYTDLRTISNLMIDYFNQYPGLKSIE